MNFEDSSSFYAYVREVDRSETRSFLVGIANALWVGALLVALAWGVWTLV